MSSIFSKSKRGLPGTKTGFTLVEMMVVVAIFLITTGIVLSNFKGFSRKSSLDLLAREMSLVIRQAQAYGSATKLYKENVNRFPSYGVYVSGNNADNFKLFADNDDNRVMKNHDVCVKDEECIEQFNLTGGVVISKVEGYLAGGGQPVSAKSSGGSEWLNILFKRPKLGASFIIKCTTDCPPLSGTGCVVTGDTAECPFSYVKITLTDQTNDEKREISVWSTGHIYVESELGNPNDNSSGAENLNPPLNDANQ